MPIAEYQRRELKVGHSKSKDQPKGSGDQKDTSVRSNTDTAISRRPSGQGHDDRTDGKPDDWSVAEQLPALRPQRDENPYRATVSAALSDGRPREKLYPTARDARLAGRRLRHAGGTLGAKITLRFTPADGGQTLLTFTAQRRDG